MMKEGSELSLLTAVKTSQSVEIVRIIVQHHFRKHLEHFLLRMQTIIANFRQYLTL